MLALSLPPNKCKEGASAPYTISRRRERLCPLLLFVYPFGQVSSSETQGQIVGTRESLNGRKNMTRRKVKNGEKSSSRRSLLFFEPYFSARLDFPSPLLSAPGSPRMGKFVTSFVNPLLDKATFLLK